MLKRVLAAFALGLGGYVIYRAFYSNGYTTAAGEGDGFDAVAGDFLNVGYQAAGYFGGNNMQISLAGLNHIKQYEGFSATPYRDSAGLLTIGYGHLIKIGESFTRISEAEAVRLLAGDVADAEAAVNRLVKVPLTQAQYDALVSFVFNVGASAFARSTMLKELNAGNYLAAQQNFTRWIYATVGGVKTVIAGLANRRLAEARLFSGANVA